MKSQTAATQKLSVAPIVNTSQNAPPIQELAGPWICLDGWEELRNEADHRRHTLVSPDHRTVMEEWSDESDLSFRHLVRVACGPPGKDNGFKASSVALTN